VAAGAIALAVVSAVPIAWLAARSVTTVHGWAAWRSLTKPPGRGALAIDTVAAVRQSLTIALTATVVATVIGALAALVVTHGRGRTGAALDAGLLLPLGTSAVTIGFGLLLTWRQLPVDVGSVLVPLAHAVVAVPFVVRTMVPVLRGIDPRVREAASMLGAAPTTVLRTIDAPLVRRAVAAGAAFAFAVSLGEFGATTFLARTGSPTLPIAVALALTRPGALNVARADALAVLLAALAVAAVAVAELAGEPLRSAADPRRAGRVARAGAVATASRP
jgi:thiamine transport system permease protein